MRTDYRPPARRNWPFSAKPNHVHQFTRQRREIAKQKRLTAGRWMNRLEPPPGFRHEEISPSVSQQSARLTNFSVDEIESEFPRHRRQLRARPNQSINKSEKSKFKDLPLLLSFTTDLYGVVVSLARSLRGDVTRHRVYATAHSS